MPDYSKVIAYRDKLHFTPAKESPRTLYGKKRDGKMYHVSKVANGLACDCVCPDCKTDLIAKQGPEKIWHFSHVANGVNCANPGETALHLNAKQIIEENGGLDTCGLINEWDRRPVSFSSIEVEKFMDGIRPDLVGNHPSDGFAEYMVIEILVTHAVGEEKRKILAERDAPALEIDLSGVSHSLTWTELKHQILTDAPRRWLHHPEVERLKKIRAERAAAADELRRAARVAEHLRRMASEEEREAREARETACYAALTTAFHRPPANLDIPENLTLEIDNWAAVGVDLAKDADLPTSFDVPPAVWRATVLEGYTPWFEGVPDEACVEDFYGKVASNLHVVKPEFTPGEMHIMARAIHMNPGFLAYQYYRDLPKWETLQEKWHAIGKVRSELSELNDQMGDMGIFLSLHNTPVSNVSSLDIARATTLAGKNTAQFALSRITNLLDQDFLNTPDDTDLAAITKAGFSYSDATGIYQSFMHLPDVLAPAKQRNVKRALRTAMETLEPYRAGVLQYLKENCSNDIAKAFLASPAIRLVSKRELYSDLNEVVHGLSAQKNLDLNALVRSRIRVLTELREYLLHGFSLAALTGSQLASDTLISNFITALPDELPCAGLTSTLARLRASEAKTTHLIERILSSRVKYGGDFMDRCIITCYPDSEVTMAEAFATSNKEAIARFDRNLFVSMTAPWWVGKLESAV
jgi:hypothetical protein